MQKATRRRLALYNLVNAVRLLLSETKAIVLLRVGKSDEFVIRLQDTWGRKWILIERYGYDKSGVTLKEGGRVKIINFGSWDDSKRYHTYVRKDSFLSQVGGFVEMNLEDFQNVNMFRIIL